MDYPFEFYGNISAERRCELKNCLRHGVNLFQEEGYDREKLVIHSQYPLTKEDMCIFDGFGFVSMPVRRGHKL